MDSKYNDDDGYLIRISQSKPKAMEALRALFRGRFKQEELHEIDSGQDLLKNKYDGMPQGGVGYLLPLNNLSIIDKINNDFNLENNIYDLKFSDSFSGEDMLFQAAASDGAATYCFHTINHEGKLFIFEPDESGTLSVRWETPVPCQVLELLVDNVPLEFVSPFDKFGYAQLRAMDLSGVLERKSKMQIRIADKTL